MEKKKSLSAKDICDIVLACKSAEVVSLQYQDLNVNFSYEFKAPILTDFSDLNYSHPTSGELVRQSVVQPQTEQLPVEDLDLLAVEDPEEWERRQIEDNTNG